MRDDVIYKVTYENGDTPDYGFTPDGEGFVWFDTLDEVRGQSGLTRVLSIDSDTFDQLREGGRDVRMGDTAVDRIVAHARKAERLRWLAKAHDSAARAEGVSMESFMSHLGVARHLRDCELRELRIINQLRDQLMRGLGEGE